MEVRNIPIFRSIDDVIVVKYDLRRTELVFRRRVRYAEVLGYIDAGLSDESACGRL